MDRPNVAILTLDFPPSMGGIRAYLYEIFNRMAVEKQFTAERMLAGINAALSKALA